MMSHAPASLRAGISVLIPCFGTTDSTACIASDASCVTVGELIYQLGLWEGQDDKCGISECVELGDGQWAKGISVFKKDDNRKKTLEEMGWDEDRADQKQPVWLCMHQG